MARVICLMSVMLLICFFNSDSCSIILVFGFPAIHEFREHTVRCSWQFHQKTIPVAAISLSTAEFVLVDVLDEVNEEFTDIFLVQRGQYALIGQVKLNDLLLHRQRRVLWLFQDFGQALPDVDLVLGVSVKFGAELRKGQPAHGTGPG